MSKKFSKRAEEFIGRVLEENSPELEWEFFVNPLDDAQYVIYQHPYKTSFPDWMGKSKRDKSLMLLVEVKSCWGYFDGRYGEVGIQSKHLHHYYRVHKEEDCPVRVVFLVRDGENNLCFWEDLINIGKMDYYIEEYEWKYKMKNKIVKEMCETVFFNVNQFRTDIKNLGKL